MSARVRRTSSHTEEYCALLYVVPLTFGLCQIAIANGSIDKANRSGESGLP